MRQIACQNTQYKSLQKLPHASIESQPVAYISSLVGLCCAKMFQLSFQRVIFSKFGEEWYPFGCAESCEPDSESTDSKMFSCLFSNTVHRYSTLMVENKLFQILLQPWHDTEKMDTEMLISNRLIESHCMCFASTRISETICHSQVEDMNSLATELVKVTAKEHVLLEQSKDFLSALASMQVSLTFLLLLLFCHIQLFILILSITFLNSQQVKDCSLRTHMIQLNRVPTTSSLTTRV